MSKRFADLLSRAIDDDYDAVEEILEMYMPLINNHSRMYGYIDEDLKQYIMLRLVKSISKFVI